MSDCSASDHHAAVQVATSCRASRPAMLGHSHASTLGLRRTRNKKGL